MRVSVEKDDPGFATLIAIQADCKDVDRVLLDGEVVERCVTADEETGEVTVVICDETGALVLDGDEVRREVRRGKVQVVVEKRTERWFG